MDRWLLLVFLLLLSCGVVACSPESMAIATAPAVGEMAAAETHEPQAIATAVRWDTDAQARVVLVTVCGGEWDPCVWEDYVPEAQIWGDGRMLLVRNAGTSDQQLREEQLTEEEMAVLMQKIADAGFFSFEEYYAAEEITDASTTCIEVALADAAQRVCEKHRGAPPAFRAIYDYITSGAILYERSDVSGAYLAALADLPPTAVVLEYALELPSHPEIERSEPLPVAQLTLLAGGTLVYVEEAFCSDGVCREQAMRAQLTPAETASLLEQVRQLGFEQLESYTDPCYPTDGGGLECIEGGGYTTLRLLLPSGVVRVLHFTEVADGHFEELLPIRAFLANYRHMDAAVYVP